MPHSSKMCGPNECYQHSPGLTTTHPSDEEGHVMATASSTVTYRDIPGFPGYRVGDDGSVWSCWRQIGRIGGGTRAVLGTEWKPLKPSKGSGGYFVVNLCRDGKQRVHRIHRLVALAFLGECPDGLEVCHGDGVPTNNCLTNLRYGTHKENAADSIRHGVLSQGERNGGSKLTEVKVREIRKLGAAGMSGVERAKLFGVGKATISHIDHRVIWKHVV